MRQRISIRGFVRPSVGPLVRWSVGPSRSSRKVGKHAFPPLPTRPRLVLAVYPALLMKKRWQLSVSSGVGQSFADKVSYPHTDPRLWENLLFLHIYA